MSATPYTLNTGKIKEYFDTVKMTGVPEKVTNNWLSSLGFKSSNDRRIISIWRYIGFIDESGAPTDTWAKYRSSINSKNVMARAILDGYRDLFEIYPDAYRKDKEALYAYFATKSRVAEKTVNYMVITFQKLVELADFEGYEESTPIALKVKERFSKKKTSDQIININLHFNLPVVNDIEIYNTIFRSIKNIFLMDEE